jgi:RecB family exonuclease
MAVEMKLDKTIKKPNVLKLSASSMKTFDQCPMRYYYQYIQKAPRKAFDHFDLGELCHKALEIFHSTYIKKGDPTISLSKLMTYSFTRARKLKKFKKMKHELIKEAHFLLIDYLKFLANEGVPKVKRVEKSFTLEMEKGLIVRGILDRLDIANDGKFHIIDYKTNKNPKYLEPFQLLIYGLWLEKKYPNIDAFDGSYVLLRHGSKYKTYNFNRQDIVKCKRKIVVFSHNIKNNMNSGDWKPNPSILCKWCDYSKTCIVNKEW